MVVLTLWYKDEIIFSRPFETRAEALAYKHLQQMTGRKSKAYIFLLTLQERL